MSLTERQRNILGVFVLLLVNVIWVLSSELTKFIFQNEKYDKPYFSTYLKSSMFTLFLCGFIVSIKWRMLACPYNYYSSMVLPEESGDQLQIQPNDALSDPIFIPINFESHEEAKTAHIDDDFVMINPDEIPDKISSQNNQLLNKKRNVKFSNYLEVRHLSETYAEESLAARMSYQASKRHKRRIIIRKIFEQGLFPAKTVLKLALQFSFCWFIASYAYQMGISSSLPSVVNVISSTASIFTLVLSSLFPSSERDRFTITKLIVVLFSMCGVIMVSLSDMNNKNKETFNYKGILWSLVGASGYAIYLVSLRRKVRDESQMSLLMFFGFVGFWTVIFLWPGFIILHWTKVEPFQLPNKIQIGALILNGIIGTVGAELLWLWGCFLTSSLTATLSLGLTIPFSMVSDYIMYKKVYNWMFYVGSIPILLSFVAISLLTGDDGPSPDPIGWCIKWILGIRNRNETDSRLLDQYEPLLETESETEDDIPDYVLKANDSKTLNINNENNNITSVKRNNDSNRTNHSSYDIPTTSASVSSSRCDFTIPKSHQDLSINSDDNS